MHPSAKVAQLVDRRIFHFCKPSFHERMLRTLFQTVCLPYKDSAEIQLRSCTFASGKLHLTAWPNSIRIHLILLVKTSMD